jgi:hypothetical protein
MPYQKHRWSPICPPPGNLVRPVRLDPSGVTGPTRGQARGEKWRRTGHGWYVPAHVLDVRPEQRVLEQSVRLPPGGAITGWAACRLWQANFFDGLFTDGRTRMPVPLVIGPDNHIRSDRHITVSRERLVAEEVVVRFGIPCVRELRALFDAMRFAPDRREAVVAMDMMAAALLVSIRQMRGYAATHARWRGVPQVWGALELASERSKSPNEVRMRMVWELDAGLPRPLVNQPVWDHRGNLLGIADLFDAVAGVVGEYDGADHRSAIRHSKDVDREDRFRRHGLEYFKVTGPDMGQVPRVVSRMHSARSRARWLSPAERPWTIEPPAGWEPEQSLDEFLEHQAWVAGLNSRWEQQSRG